MLGDEQERQLFERPTLEKIQAADRCFSIMQAERVWGLEPHRLWAHDFHSRLRMGIDYFDVKGMPLSRSKTLGWLRSTTERQATSWSSAPWLSTFFIECDWMRVGCVDVALLQFDYTFPSTPEEEELFEKAKLPCHLNLAACKLQQRDFDEVYIQCRLALQMDPKNCKAFYRRGMAQMMQDHLDDAQQSFAAALEVEPANPHVIKALAELRTKKADYIKTSTDTYRRMFRSKAKSQHTKQQQQMQQQQQQQIQQQQQTEQQQQKVGEEQHSSRGAAARQSEPSCSFSASQQQRRSPDQQLPQDNAELQQETQQQQELQQAEQQLEQQQRTRQQQETAKHQARQQQPEESSGEQQASNGLLSGDDHGTQQHEQQQQQQEKLLHRHSASSRSSAERRAADSRLPKEPRAAAAAAVCAAAAAEGTETAGGCGLGCACRGQQVERSPGRGFDPRSAIRWVRKEPQPLRTHYRRSMFPAAAAITAAAAVVMACVIASCGLVTLSPAVVAAVTAAAQAAAAAGPWAVGAALLLALLTTALKLPVVAAAAAGGAAAAEPCMASQAERTAAAASEITRASLNKRPRRLHQQQQQQRSSSQVASLVDATDSLLGAGAGAAAVVVFAGLLVYCGAASAAPLTRGKMKRFCALPNLMKPSAVAATTN
ncbi:hypothetical protein Esti_005780 [Eimeria stiedai]